ncbi:MAG TPA: carboxypeptidase-like regulatory domain-containing protein, partial [Candidatus Kapabacteria bacterium]|nr:carboxypeptidase-like regulatory domain-containing protein [Candidatus Kapabacteria bacterium]
MHLRYQVFIVLVILPVLGIAQPAKVKLTGRIIASDTHETIPGASLSILGTSRGARSNKLGSYLLELDAEQEYRIRISSLGYKTDTIHVKVSKSEIRDFTLKVSPLQASEITISADASRKEARRIMHRAIDEKMKWQPQIINYICDVYSRINVQKIESNDTTLLSIFETYSNGYYDKDKGRASHIIARKQTANVPADLNQISLLGISSFYDDRINID